MAGVGMLVFGQEIQPVFDDLGVPIQLIQMTDMTHLLA
jgi:hypothetical protein